MITLTLLHPIQSIPVQTWTFENDAVIRIGRSTDNNVILYSAVVSRYHVELRFTDNQWEIVNLGANGTYLEGKRITQAPVTDGVIIRLARSGPNIQIHTGATALERAAKRMGGDQTLSQRRDKPTVPISEESPNHPVTAPPDVGGEAVVPGHSRTAIDIERPTREKEPDASGCLHPRAEPGLLFCLDCGQPLQASQRIGNYQVLKTLGYGGMGITYLGWKDGHSVVIKTLNADWVNEEKARELFEREAQVLRQLSHPSVPQWQDFFVLDGHPYLVMEMIYGQNLWQWVDQRGPTTQRQAVSWMLEVCDVLAYLHQQDPPILHRDIKPENLIRRKIAVPGREIVVVDFGAVKVLAPEAGTRIGSAGYTAPEQQEGQALPASDLYSLGPTLIYLLTGQDPSSFYAQREQGFRLYAEYVPGLTPEMTAVIRKLTHPNPNNRYASAHEVMEALQQVERD